MDIPQSKSLLPRWLTPFLYIGPIALFLFATAYGVLEVHSSTDTWIGLAAGRQILTSDEFPTTDTFSFTFNGKPWYNQNWLTHVFQYWLYSHVAPNAVIYGTWTLAALVFFFTLLASYWRSGTWLGAILAAAVVGLGCRDFLSARPATTGFFFIAALWALVCAVEGQRDKRRWWPIVLLLPLMLLWGNAHGSFVFGYGVLGLYVGHWFVVRTIRVRRSWIFSLAAVLAVMAVGGVAYSFLPEQAQQQSQGASTLVLFWRPCDPGKVKMLAAALPLYCVYWTIVKLTRPRLAISDRQVFAIVAVVILSVILTIAFGPFGLHNFTHGNKIAGSEIFRQVSEWTPPLSGRRSFPPVWRFFTILWVSIGMLLASAAIWLLARGANSPSKERGRLHVSLFDVTVIAIGLSMTFWARRFAPIYFIFGAPVFLTWIMILTRRVKPEYKAYFTIAAAAGAGLFTFGVAYETISKARNELVTPYAKTPQFSLLERVTRFEATPHMEIRYLAENDLHANMLVEWTQAGVVMFMAPNVKVFMDGRAQQVYNEYHYKMYSTLLGNPNTPRAGIVRALDQYGVDAALLRRMGPARNASLALEQTGDWVTVLLSPGYSLYLRKGSPALEKVGRLLRSGEEWRPDDPMAAATRGFVWMATSPPDPIQAVRCWNEGVRQDIRIGSFCFQPMTQALIEMGRADEASAMVSGYYSKLKNPVEGLNDNVRRGLLSKLTQCWQDVSKATEAKNAGND